MYKPTDVDQRFAQELTRVLKDGASWVWPSNGLHYVLDKCNRTMMLVNQDLLDDPENLHGHLQTIATFATADYQVLPDIQEA
jgi:hypothetical protein